MKDINKLLSFLSKSVTSFHAVEGIKKELLANDFAELFLTDDIKIEYERKYFITKNDSSIIAFKTPKSNENFHFQMIASHTDSPTYKLKPKYVVESLNQYTSFNIETYGGPIHSTWLDRPLSVAGRVMIKEGNEISSHLINIDKDLLVIPNMPIHLNSDANQMKYNPQVDMQPLFGSKGCNLAALIATKMCVDESNIIDADLFLYNRFRGCILGANDEFILAPQIDDLEMAYGSLQGFIVGCNPNVCSVYASFDNEEVGSQTKQGAKSTFLRDTLELITSSFGFDTSQYNKAIAKSFMISADNAHAVHPNHPEKFDKTNICHLNKGIAIKYNANQSYTTDALSSSVFKYICDASDVNYQEIANRSDIKGGSTLGNLSTTQVACDSVDIGLPQLAMHSSCETAGCDDYKSMIKVSANYYSINIIKDKNGYKFIK